MNPNVNGGPPRPGRKREAKRTSPPGENEAKPGPSGSNGVAKKGRQPGEIRRARSTSDLPSDQQSVRSGRSRSADLSGDSAGFIRTKPKKANILMMKEYSFELTKEAFQAQSLNEMKRADHPFLLKFRPGEGERAVKVAGPDYSWDFKKYLPKNFTENIPENMKVLEEDHALGLRNILSREQCQRMDDYLSTGFAQIFGDCSLSDRRGSRPFIDNPIPQVRALNEPAAEQVIETQIRNKLERERHFRQRSRIVPHFGYMKTLHGVSQNFFDIHVINNDSHGFIQDLNDVAWKIENPKIEFDSREIRNPLHLAAELCRLELVQDLLHYLQTARQSARELVYTWMNWISDRHLLPFQTALLTDNPDRFLMADVLISSLDSKNKNELIYPTQNGAKKYKESALDLVILSGNIDFTRHFIRKIGEMNPELKKNALLPLVCSGDTQLLLEVWNSPPQISPTAFCITTTTGDPFGYAAESPFLVAIDRGDINMVHTILQIYPSAADTSDIIHGFLPYQYAMLVGASEEIVILLREKCRLPFDLNAESVGLWRIMGTALRCKCRPLYEEAMHLMWKEYHKEPYFNLPGIIRYAFVSQFYDVVENILNSCISHETLRKNMHEELKQFYAFLLTSRNIDEEVFDKLHSLLHKNGITMEIVMEYVKEENRKMKSGSARHESHFNRPFPTRRQLAMGNRMGQ